MSDPGGAAEAQAPSGGAAKAQAPAVREKVYGAIREAIITGTYRPAQRLVEAEVASRLGVSKTPVREALYRLEQEGLVESARNRGFSVRVITSAEVREVYELRELYEGACARAAASSPEHVAIAGELFSLNSQASEALARDDVVEVHRLFSRFDDLIFTQSPNRMLRDQVERISVLIGINGTVSNYIPGRIRRSVSEHMAIVSAIRDGNPAEAETCTRDHIRSLLADQVAADEIGGMMTGRPTG
jgi:DNA-binding GntR family transcriptional regulator